MGSYQLEKTAPIITIPLDSDPPGAFSVDRTFQSLADEIAQLKAFVGYLNKANTWTQNQTFDLAIVVVGATTLEDGLVVLGDSTLNGDLDVTGNEIVGGTLGVTGATTLGSVFSIGGDGTSGIFGVPAIVDQRTAAQSTSALFIGGVTGGITPATGLIFRVTFFSSVAEGWSITFTDTTGASQNPNGTLPAIGSGGDCYSISTLIRIKAGTAIKGELSAGSAADQAITVE